MEFCVGAVVDAMPYEAEKTLVGIVGELVLKEGDVESVFQWGVIIERLGTDVWATPEVPD